jgi:hypothetical protein
MKYFQVVRRAQVVILLKPVALFAIAEYSRYLKYLACRDF